MLLREKGKMKNLFQELVIESVEQKSKFSSIRKNLIKQSQQLIDDSLKERVKLDLVELFKISLPSFLKSSKIRDIKDISLISLYLVQMKKFMKIFGDNFTSIKDSGYFEQLKKISSTIIYEKFNKNRIIVKHGDEGKKFFLILKGEVQVLLPTKKNVRMKQNEFKRYMLLLFIYKEYELLRLVIKENKVNETIFNANYCFFLEENTNAINTNASNTNEALYSTAAAEEDNKVNNNNINSLYKDFKFGFNKVKEEKNINNSSEMNNEEKNKFKLEQREKFLKLLMKNYLTKEEIAYYEKTKDINLKEVDDGIKIFPIEYMNRIIDYSSINIKIHFNDDEDSYLFANDDSRSYYFIYEYKKHIELATGDIFGDLALTKNNIKRTATIISLDECHFACLTRELFSSYIEKGNERIINNKINYLLSINILKTFPRFILEKKLFNYFGFKNFIKDKYILQANEINNNIIFLKDGIFEVSFTGKLSDLSNLINLYYIEYNNLATKKDREELDENITNNVNLIGYQQHKIETIFQRYIDEEFSYTLFLVNAPSIFGLRETEKKISKSIINSKMTKDKIYYYQSNIYVKCSSSKGEYIYIDKNIFYKFIYGTDAMVQEETKSYVLEILLKFLRRLLNIRYIKLWNLFLLNGIEKNLISNINLEKMQQNENIYKVVNKLLSILKEGQLYSNEISKNISDYYDKIKKNNKIKKQLIKSIHQNYEKDKFQKFIESNQNNEIKKDKILTYNTKKFKINSMINSNKISSFILKTNLNNSIKKENRKDKSYIKNKIKKRNEKLTNSSTTKDIRFKQIKLKSHNLMRTNSSENNNYTNTYNKNISESQILSNSKIKNEYINQMKQNKATSFISNTCDSKIVRKRKKINSFGFENISSENINNNNNELSLLRIRSLSNNNFNKNFYFSTNRPNTSKSLLYSNNFDYDIKNRKEKYIRERINYVIRNTRIIFTKTRNLDKIVRIRRENSII